MKDRAQMPVAHLQPKQYGTHRVYKRGIDTTNATGLYSNLRVGQTHPNCVLSCKR